MKGFHINNILILLIKIYNYLISGFLPDSCRFTPSCSSYAIDALKKYSVFAGLWLTIKRISKCHPLYKTTGYDPVP